MLGLEGNITKNKALYKNALLFIKNTFFQSFQKIDLFKGPSWFIFLFFVIKNAHYQAHWVYLGGGLVFGIPCYIGCTATFTLCIINFGDVGLLIDALTTNVPHHIETSQLICIANILVSI